jgi:hypothetical protein
MSAAAGFDPAQRNHVIGSGWRLVTGDKLLYHQLSFRFAIRLSPKEIFVTGASGGATVTER